MTNRWDVGLLPKPSQLQVCILFVNTTTTSTVMAADVSHTFACPSHCEVHSALFTEIEMKLKMKPAKDASILTNLQE